MAYDAKTNWQTNETVMPADMNRVEQGIEDVDNGLAAHKTDAAAHSTEFGAKQNKITASGIIKGDGAGGVSAATGGTDFQEPTQSLTAETVIDDADSVPFYDSSAVAHRRSTWVNFKGVLKTYFDTIYSLVKFGGGYTSSVTAVGTAAKTASLSNYVAVTGGIVVVKFTNGNSAANPTMNINVRGAKPLFYNGVACGNIPAGFVGILQYDGTNYNILNAMVPSALLMGDAKAGVVPAVAGTDYVAPSTTVNGKPLSSDVTLNAADIDIVDSGGNFTATDVEGVLEELFTSGSSLKSSLTTAITAKGGTVNKAGEYATEAELVAGVGSIQELQTASGTATVSTTTQYFSEPNGNQDLYKFLTIEVGFVPKFLIASKGTTWQAFEVTVYQDNYNVSTSGPSPILMVTSSGTRYTWQNNGKIGTTCILPVAAAANATFNWYAIG